MPGFLYNKRTMSQAPDHPEHDQRLLVMLRISQELNASLNPNEVLERVLEDVIVVTGAERGIVMLVDNLLDSDTRLHPRMHGIDHNLASDELAFPRSVLEQVIQTREAVLTNDAQNDQRFSGRNSIINMSLRSILCVPVQNKERLMGVIYVDSRIHKGVFSAADRDLLMAIASSAAIALENARLYLETQSRLERLDLLRRISQEITATLEIERVLSVTTQAVKELLRASAASILTVEGDELVFQVAIGKSASAVKPFRLPLTQGIAGWVVAHRQAAIVNDVKKDPRFYGILDKKSGFLTESVMAVPMIANDKAIGVIEVFNKPGGFSSHDLDLLVTFSSSAAFAIENARLYQVAVEKGRMERELQMARQVQASFLPQHTPSLPGWELVTRWLPAREVAGDYFDFIQLENGPHPPAIGLVVADVADKGMPAALFMVDTRSTLRASMYGAAEPAHGITHANTLLYNEANNGMFVTLFYACIEASSPQITYVNAGHNPPLLLRTNQAEPTLLKRTGMAMGIDPAQTYTQVQTNLQQGDLIVFYTDGVPDALNANGREFGMERLREIILQNRNTSAEGIISALEAALQKHIGEQPPFDDITLLVLKRTV